MKCWNCGTQNQKTAKICKKCGSDLTQAQPESTSIDAPKTGMKTKPILWIVLGAAAIVLISILLIFAINYNSRHTFNKIVEATLTAAVEIPLGENGDEDNNFDYGDSALSSVADQGEGCEYATCAWMAEDQCVSCGGTWQDFGDESFCDCSEEKWQSQELEWCRFEGGSWLIEEDRCTFQNSSSAAGQTVSSSACANLYYAKTGGDETDFQAYRASCKDAGGVDQCWDEACSLSVCICPNEDGLPASCNWAADQEVDSSIFCYEDTSTCWLTIEPTGAFSSLGEGVGQLDAIVTTSEGDTYTSVDLERDTSGCIHDENRITCLLTKTGTFDTEFVENIYLCMNQCCQNLDNLISGGTTTQSGDCPGGGDLEIRDFNLVQGALTLKISNRLGWETDSLDVFLDDAKGDHWTTLSCHTDSKYDNVMECKGWAVYKSGFATLNFDYGSGARSCSVTGVRFQIPEMNKCNYDQHYCAYSDTCCSSGKTCCSCGCKSLDDGETCSDVCD
jgi:hypothetical protein